MKIVSGGQTGVDRAALDVAMELGMACGGWCPAGRWAEDGPIDARYPLRETPSADPAQRTEWNVRDSDATLILASGAESAGTELTREAARRLGKPLYTFHAGALEDAGALRRWLQVASVRTLNVAGPRESEAPGIYAGARRILTALLGRGNGFAPPLPLDPI
ncbi:putative molybdenum carrier protein [Longimicrobium sp.]|uniref:putative molybdenum carrier protein n=1 Tax=Longimicrobium sp. TaxID=2029185 RepID=UPI002CDD09A2|nr:putative molybdenum carrier protein [Longimicrobium sp.]HSU14631.1 putative molybdenum carrier protein [Longimicrobium sp.]